MSKDFSELRRHPRLNVDFFVDWGGSVECEYYDRVTSVSISGCFLATRRELRAGDEIFLKFSYESAGRINLKGAIRYQLRVMEGGLPTGAGVEFINVATESEKKLQAVMNGYK